MNKGIINVIIVLVMVEVLDEKGKMIGVEKRGGMIEKGKKKNMGREMFEDRGEIIEG